MTDQAPKPKVRKLRTTQETMRERAERTSAKQSRTDKKPRPVSTKAHAVGSSISSSPIWKPFKFVGRFIIPPYFRASWRELRQVTWPNGRQTRELTGAVILFSVVFGIIIAAFDYGLDKIFKQIILSK